MNKILKKIYHMITLDWLFPWQYSRYRNQSIKCKKVIFIGASLPILSNSIQCLYDELDKKGGYQLEIHYFDESFKNKFDYISKALRCLKEMATANYIVLSHASRLVSCLSFRPETKVIQLWHGCGAFKRFGLSTAKFKFGGSYQDSNNYPYHRNLDLVTVSSPEVIWAYGEAMDIPSSSNIIRATGISRTDLYFQEDFITDAVKRIKSQLPEHLQQHKLLLWAPTFRGNVGNPSAPEYPDLLQMKEALGDKYLLLIKHHPIVTSYPAIPSDASNFAYDISGECKIEDLICCCDMCISDYSSLVFEYSLMERPMLFFASDKSDYEDWRGFYYPYEAMTPGPIAATTTELIGAIQRLDKYFDPSEVITFKNKFMSSCDGYATKRIIEFMNEFTVS